MTDVFSKQMRSEVMSRLRSSHTRAELAIKFELEQTGLRFAYQPRIGGHPDFVVEDTVAVFVNGCFWHGCPHHYREPKSNVSYWREKVERNRALLNKNSGRLRREDYSDLCIWEHNAISSTGNGLSRIWRALLPGRHHSHAFEPTAPKE